MNIVQKRRDLVYLRKAARYLGQARDWKRRQVLQEPGLDPSHCLDRIEKNVRWARMCNRIALKEFRKLNAANPGEYQPCLHRWLYWDYPERNPASWLAEAVYGYPGEDTHPFDFEPDIESCQPEEVINHRRAVEDARAGRAWISSGHSLISHDYGWGIGVKTYWWTREDWMNWGGGV